MTDRRDLLRLIGLLVALLVVAGAIMLATQGGSDASDGGRDGEAEQVDGVVTQVSSERLVLQPTTGGAPMTFSIRAVDLPKFDVFHLEQHAADGLPTRVTYIEDGEQRYALRADDAPLA